MGGRGSFASGNNVELNYETIDYIDGIPVVKGKNGKHSLPEESHKSNAYIKLDKNNNFYEMRIYDKDHYLVKEIAYHPEPDLTNGNKKLKVLHIHEYERDNFIDRPARKLTNEEIKKYKKYFIGVTKYD